MQIFRKFLCDILGEICQNVNYDVIGGHWRSNGGQIEVASKIRWVSPKTRPLGEGVCKFSENSDMIYWLKYVKMSIMTSLEVTGGQIEVKSR